VFVIAHDKKMILKLKTFNHSVFHSSVYNAPGARAGNDNWDYAFEGENGIKQEATGVMRSVGGSDVIVMKGSYEYIGADNQVYVVEWEADENGFRADAPHLPKSVPIPFPEQQVPFIPFSFTIVK
jgi:hypothetical protein